VTLTGGDGAPITVAVEAVDLLEGTSEVVRFLLRKLGHVLVVLFLVSLVVGFLLDLTPGDPAYAILGDQVTPAQVALVHKQLHLDDPFLTRYGRWLGNVLHGDFGSSYQTGEKVTDQIRERAPVSIELIVLAMLIALSISIPAGVYSAYRADGRFDRVWSLFSSVLIGIPPFVSALVFVSVFGLALRNFPIHFPVTGWTPLTQDPVDNLWHAFLPSLTLGLAMMPAFSRVLRADMISTLQEDYVLAARAKGVPPRRILLRHALRPSSFSLLTLAGISLGQLIGATVIVETVFALPGIGALIISDILMKDVVTVQGVVMFVAIVYVLLNTSLDLVYRALDPRIRTRSA